MKVFGSCLKKSKDYRSFHEISSTSQGHNFLNFWNFWVILFDKCSLRGLLHVIFESQEKILSGSSFLKRKDYRSFLESWHAWPRPGQKNQCFFTNPKGYNSQLKHPLDFIIFSLCYTLWILHLDQRKLENARGNLIWPQFKVCAKICSSTPLVCAFCTTNQF